MATVAPFTMEVNPRLAKRPLKTNGRLANRGSTSLVKEATVVSGGYSTCFIQWHMEEVEIIWRTDVDKISQIPAISGIL